jgi:hypothetical protein
VIGDFADDGWTTGVSMALDAGTWQVITGVPWDTRSNINFGRWVGPPRPQQPQQVDDGFGGFNSVLDPMTCRLGLRPSGFASSTGVPIICFVFVDRFQQRSEQRRTDRPRTGRWRGDWAGVMQKIDEGYFDDLGVNCLWLSVPMNNTHASGAGTDGHQYSAYHGLAAAARPDRSTLALAELTSLVSSHARHQVLFDYAMNHVHERAVYTATAIGLAQAAAVATACVGAAAWDGASGRAVGSAVSARLFPRHRAGIRSTTRCSGSPTRASTVFVSTPSSTSRISGCSTCVRA